MSHQDNPKHFPALAPGPPRMFAGPSSMAVTRPKKNSTACLACKQAKRKCSGPPSPCKACLSAGAEDECQFDPSRDLRRKVAVKRTIQELADYKKLLDSLLSTIRIANPDKLGEITELLKSNGSMRDLACAVGSPVTHFADTRALASASQLSISEDGEQSLESPVTEFANKLRRPLESDKVSTSPEEEHYMDSARVGSNPYRVTLESLCDIPLYQVPAKPWTEVTDDTDFVSHLVSLYFTWDHPCAQFLDQGVFLEHMRRQDLNSEFCSPLLVNSLLSVASIYSDSPRVLSNPDNTFSRGQPFFAEAEILWVAQEGRATLSNIQALLMLCCVLSYQGKPDLSWLMLQQAVQLAQDIGLFMLPRSKHRFREKMTAEMERSRTITAWGIFSLNRQMSMKLHKMSALPRPASGIDTGGEHDFDWTPYPRSNQITYATKRAHLPQVRQGLADLTEIMMQVEELLDDEELSSNFSAIFAKAEQPYTRLQQWLAAWPNASQNGNEPVPQLLIVRIKCLQAIMHLIEMLIERDQQGTEIAQLKHKWFAQAEEMAQCLRIHRQSYGTKHIPSQLVDAVQTALRVLVHHLEDQDEIRQAAFTEICRFGIALSEKFKPTAETINAIHSMALQGSVKLPNEAIAILDGSELRRVQESI